MDIGVNDDVLSGRGSGNGIPDLEAGSVLCPAGVSLNDLLGHSGTVGVAQSVDHGDFEGDVHALTLIDLVHHFDRICPTFGQCSDQWLKIILA